jgi:hypothetical protein
MLRRKTIVVNPGDSAFFWWNFLKDRNRIGGTGNGDKNK